MARLWLALFVVAAVSSVYQWLVLGHPAVFAAIIQASFDMGKLAVTISIGLIGVLALWLGLFRIAELAGLMDVLARALAPLFRRLMPEVPPGHPALGSVTMNLAANVLGLDNAATSLGLKAMQDLQSLNRGSTETTFYVLAVYFGSVGIRRSRHAVTCGLLADLAGIVTAILVGYWFYH